MARPLVFVENWHAALLRLIATGEETRPGRESKRIGILVPLLTDASVKEMRIPSPILNFGIN